MLHVLVIGDRLRYQEEHLLDGVTCSFAESLDEVALIFRASAQGKLRAIDGVVVYRTFLGVFDWAGPILDTRIIAHVSAEQFLHSLRSRQNFLSEMQSDPEFRQLDHRWRSSLGKDINALTALLDGLESSHDAGLEPICHRLRGTADNFGEVNVGILAANLLAELRNKVPCTDLIPKIEHLVAEMQKAHGSYER